MNSRQAAQYQRGLEIARRDALTVVAHGTRKRDGAAAYCVPSRSQANTWHVVVVSGLDLQCDCQAAQYGTYCCHRAAVRARLLLEGQLRREAHERDVERAFHAAAREVNVKLSTPSHLGPKPRDDQTVVSVFK